jgi:hypothetical protein
MPLSTILPDKDGYALVNTGTHAGSRGASTADSVAHTGTQSTTAISYQRGTKGGIFYLISRTFMYFDTSGITDTITDATLKIYGSGNGTGDVIVLKSTAFGGDGSSDLVAGDYDNIDFSTAYSSEIDTWSTSNFNNITLNSTAQTDIKNNDAFIIAITNYDFDHQDTDPGVNVDLSNGALYVDFGDSSRRPKLEVTTEDPPTIYNFQLTSGLLKITEGLVKV